LLSSWRFGSFWLKLEAPLSAAATVMILALPTRGQGMEKATFRLIATVIGVAGTIAIVCIFTQTDVLSCSWGTDLHLPGELLRALHRCHAPRDRKPRLAIEFRMHPKRRGPQRHSGNSWGNYSWLGHCGR
jgi:hypothetical protein